MVGFLSTHDGKYIITDTGKKIVAFDYSFKNAILQTTSFSNKSKTNTSYSNQVKS